MDENTFLTKFYDRITIECRARGMSMGELSLAVGKGESYLRVCKSKKINPSAYTFVKVCAALGLSADALYMYETASSKSEKLLQLYESNPTFRQMAESLM